MTFITTEKYDKDRGTDEITKEINHIMSKRKAKRR